MLCERDNQMEAKFYERDNQMEAKFYERDNQREAKFYERDNQRILTIPFNDPEVLKLINKIRPKGKVTETNNREIKRRIQNAVNVKRRLKLTFRF